MGKGNDKLLKEYLRIKEIQGNVTKKLMNYIGEFIMKNDMKNISIEFPFYGASDRNRIITFNIWLSMDYITPYGKSFIDHFLDDMRDSLTLQEKVILKERKKSYLTLFIVEEVRGSYIIVSDVFSEHEHKLLEPEAASNIHEGNFFLGRVANVLQYEKTVGILYIVPEDIVEDLIYEISMDHSMESRKIKGLDFVSYSRKFSRNIYAMYEELLDDFLEGKQILDEVVGELNEFYNYMIKDEKLKDKTARKHASNLGGFYYFCLSNKDITLYDINAKIVDEFLENGIVENFFSSKTILSGYILSIKKYANFLNNQNVLDDEDYYNILEISKNRNYYINKYEMYIGNKVTTFNNTINTLEQSGHFDRNNQETSDKHNEKVNSGKVIDFFEAKKKMRQ